MRRIIFLLILCLLVTSIISAQDGIPDNCENPNSPYAMVNTFARYDRNSNQLWLADWSTGENIRLIDDSFEDEVRIINWSPDCRYLAIAEGVSYSARDYGNDGDYESVTWSIYSHTRIYIYDIPSGELIQNLSSGRNTWVRWRSDSRRALSSGWLWNIDTNSIHRIYAVQRRRGTSIYWDNIHNWLWVTDPYSTTLYSQDTGEVIERLPLNVNGTYVRLTFSPDNQYVALHGNNNYQGWQPSIAIYNLTTFEGIQLNVENFAGYELQFSPDSRYLASAGQNTIRIWDLWNLSANYEERLPIHTIPYDGEWQFIDNNTLEVVGPATIRWDMATGEPTVIQRD